MRYLSILLLLLALADGAAANTLPLPGQGATITVPDTWTLLKRPNVVLVAASPGDLSALGIIVSSNGSHLQADTPDFIRGMTQGIVDKAQAGGYAIKVIEAGSKMLNGVPAAFVQTRQTYPNHRTIYSRAYTVAANGGFYRLSLDTQDPGQDAVLEGIAESFRFTPPPQVPGPNDFIVHRAGEMVGVVLILGLAIFFLRTRIRRLLGL